MDSSSYPVKLPLRTVRELWRRGGGTVHMVGVGGVGMAGLAHLLVRAGFQVSGCDVQEGPLLEWLRGQGVAVSAGHSGDHVTETCDAVIVSSAIPADHPERRRAHALKVPVFARGRVLAAWLDGHRSVAVCGTHGKTTTATWLVQLFKACGVPVAWCIGGVADALGGVAGIWGEGEPVRVVEADESDGTLACYAPEVALMTNLEPDHMEYFGDMAALDQCFGRMAGKAAVQVYGCDDPGLGRAVPEHASRLSFGFAQGADVTCADLESGAASSTFDLVRHGEVLGRVHLPVAGRHQVLNALGVAAVGLHWGLDPAAVVAALGQVTLPHRRFEAVAESGGVRVISDYAHHPSEIRAVCRAAALQGARRVLAVFQPHRYTRTLALGPEFCTAFEGVDLLVLTPVYAASEAPLEGGRTHDLYAHFRQAASAGAGPGRTVLAASVETAWPFLRRQLQPGDLLLVLGAGDVERMAGWARHDVEMGYGLFWNPEAEYPGLGEMQSHLECSQVRLAEPVGFHTTLGVGGAADIWVEAGSLRDLERVVQWARERRVRLRLLGGGSNVCIWETGWRGVLLHLAGEAFGQVAVAEDGRVMAGGGTPLARLLHTCAEAGWGGLEFLEGIPGTVGGAVRMNAGAWECQTADCLETVRVLSVSGGCRTLTREQLQGGYRHCAGLGADDIVLEAVFTLQREDPGALEALRQDYRQRRLWMRGLRTAGSVFLNPADVPAGRWIDSCHLKGLRVGGVCVSLQHANVFQVEAGGTASDFAALVETVRETVRRECGVELKREVEYLGETF